MSDLRIFIVHTSEDKQFLHEFEKHIKPLAINTWHEGFIRGGEVLDTEIQQHLQEANVIILLISVDFLANDHIYNEQLSVVMQKHARGEAYIIPIILRDCLWQNSPFAHLKVFPTDRKPAIRGSESEQTRDEIFAEIARNIAEVLAKKNLFSSVTIGSSSRTTGTSQEIDNNTALGKPQLGKDVHKLCNRDSQMDTFKYDFVVHLKTRQPHVFIIYGAENQVHASLIERLYIGIIKDKIESKFKISESVAIQKRDVNLSIVKNNLKDSQKNIQYKLGEVFEWEDEPILSGTDVLAIPTLQNYKLVLLKHDILHASWRPEMLDLIRWYIGDFWNVTATETQPQFVILLNIICPENPTSTPIMTQIETLSQELSEHCTLLDELEDVYAAHLTEWLDDHKLRDLIDEQELINAVLKGKEQECMRLVERELKTKAEEARMMMEF